jgi:hypothetical protein
MEQRAPSLRLVDAASTIPGHLVGHLVAHGSEGPVVDYPGNPHGPLPARSLVQVPAMPREGERIELLLVFDAQRSDRPIVTGVFESRPPLLPSVEARVDGKRVLFDAQDEVVLRCGKASITLRRNGRVVIRGTHVETRAEGVNRIRGGSVQIN